MVDGHRAFARDSLGERGAERMDHPAQNFALGSGTAFPFLDHMVGNCT